MSKELCDKPMASVNDWVKKLKYLKTNRIPKFEIMLNLNHEILLFSCDNFFDKYTNVERTKGKNSNAASPCLKYDREIDLIVNLSSTEEKGKSI